MRIPRIYLPLDLNSTEQLRLTDHAFQHTVKVLRLKLESKIIIFDGRGNEYYASLSEVNKKDAFIKVEDVIENNSESNLNVHLGLGISNGELMDFAIKKAV